jgi:flagellar L-ring protein precursor FlgH
MRQIAVVLVAVAALAACQSGAPLGAPPQLSAVGDGIDPSRAPVPAAYREPETRAPSSLWSQANAGLFRDLRAHAVGDVVTVSIDIDDQAQFDNASGRSKEGSAKAGFGLSLGLDGFGTAGAAGSADGSFDASGSASAKGEGTIDRSEKLHLTVAAVVTEVLPGGNMLISGSQEIRVNNEVRVLSIAGIVRPLDISADNLVAYDKIAEARVSYGGRGKLSAVQ